MMRERRNAWLALAVAMALTPGCQAGESGAEAGGGTPAGDALPGLLGVMAGLEQDMAGLSSALWRADFAAIGDHATSIATHPQVPPAERQAIAGILGQDMAAFKAVDTRVHDLAVRIQTQAQEQDLDAILTTEAELRQGCVACHTNFRDRLRAGRRPVP